jgi:chromosome segregation ATPase
MQTKDKEIAAMSQDNASQVSALKVLEGELEEARENLHKVTAGDYTLPNALEDIRSLRGQIAQLQQARTALIDEVCTHAFKTICRACWQANSGI